MREHKGLKPQDILVLLWLILHAKDNLRQIDAALALGLSQAEIGLSFSRLLRSRLITHDRIPIKAATLEFLISGLKYVYPAEPGAITRGIPTAHSASPLSNKLQGNDDSYVWSDPEGKERGQSIAPLYKSVPIAAKKDTQLYELLALIDAIRVGRAREANFAADELEKRIRGINA